MKQPLSSSLGVGPMSPEIVEAVFRFSHFHRKQLMLIASKNQIDHSGGYVSNWHTAQYMDFIRQMRGLYTNSDILICRDHCGPGFNGNFDLKDVYATIEDDIENGFDLIHIDFCHHKGSREEKLAESKKAIEYCLKLKSDIFLEIGTDENAGANYSLPNISEIEEEIDFFKSFCSPQFYVVQTGTLVKEINQTGQFNSKFVEQIIGPLKDKGLKLKEHNADYLSLELINAREGLVDAMNIAPQLGVAQTSLLFAKCLEYGVNIEPFMEEVYSGGKWKKWMHNSSPENKLLCFFIAGHYHFASEKYQKIIEQLKQCEDIRETFINGANDIINHYQS